MGGRACHRTMSRLRNAVVARATVNVTIYGRGPSGISNRSVDIAKLEAATGQKINAVPVMRTNAPVPVDARTTQQLKIFRPSVANIGTPKLEAPPRMRLEQEKPDLSSPALPSTDRSAAEAIMPAADFPSRATIDSPSPDRLSVPDLGSRSLPSGGLGGGGGLGGAGGLLGR